MTSWRPALGAKLASLWFTLACFGGLAAILLYGRIFDAAVDGAVAVPFALLALNLVAALATSQRLRSQGGLLTFHLALAVLALLAAIGRLTGLSGHVEITEGAAFDAGLVSARAGPLHDRRLDRVRFVQADFTINYGPGMKREDTRSRVLIPDLERGARLVSVGDDRPLIVDGYRFYTSFNKGFAPVLSYVDRQGRASSGAVHLPSYPLNDFRQGNSWTLPNSAHSIKIWLHLPEPVYAIDAAWRFRKPHQASLVVIDGDDRRELRPGEAMSLQGGTLRYDELRGWMGYVIDYDPTVPWMVGAAVAGALGLAWHIAMKLCREMRSSAAVEIHA